MGVLLSLGAHKRNVVAQIATELVIVGTIGFTLASISGTFLAKSMGESIISSQTTASEKQSERNFGRPGAKMSQKGSQMPSGMDNTPTGMDFSAKNMKQLMAANQNEKIELDINATPTDFLLLFVIGYLVIILALILPATSIMRYQPKEILTGNE